MAFSGPMEDQLAIRALNETYCDAVFLRDPVQWGSTWAIDAHWDLMGTQVDGREAIVGLWTMAMEGFKFVAFFGQISAIEVDGDTATGRVFTHEELEMNDGTERKPIGRYDDRYVRVDGQWYFQERRFKVLRG
ncbi:nuclear transport factor 2 family protein [Novosphingobium sp. Chol11]|uniref:nuclear transport factor 2 family protein n=1 Tax=Novosphingobium sp. Chol11 TaxID=1385763 RepID=UPI0025DCCCFA|nr:nuclear transport factor 2 family protein [Novosphingobium sp. Chol11]